MGNNKEIRTKISGVMYNCSLTGIPRQKIISSHVHPGTRLTPLLEPDNPYSKNAVALHLYINSYQYHLGYLNEELAADVADYLRGGVSLRIVVLEVTGGTDKKQRVGVNLLIEVLG